MTPSDQTRLETQLQRLQLRHFKTHYQAAADRAAEQQRSHVDYLAQLSDGETTIERVASLLATVPKGVLMHRDEIAGWLLGMNAYNEGARSFWLEAYGGRRYRVDRRKHPQPIIIQRFAASWFGGIQPDKVSEVLEGADDGLLARLVWFWPEPMEFTRPKRPPAIEWAIAALDRLRMLTLAEGEDGLFRW